MIYSFACPHPCSRVIQVEARNDEDAVRKLIDAGAMTCRNEKCGDPCNRALPFITPLSHSELREAVRLSMLRGNIRETPTGLSMGAESN